MANSDEQVSILTKKSVSFKALIDAAANSEKLKLNDQLYAQTQELTLANSLKAQKEAAVTAAQANLDNLNTQVQTMEASLKTLQASIEAQQEAVVSAKAAYDTSKGKLDNLQKQLEVLQQTDDPKKGELPELIKERDKARSTLSGDKGLNDGLASLTHASNENQAKLDRLTSANQDLFAQLDLVKASLDAEVDLWLTQGTVAVSEGDDFGDDGSRFTADKVRQLFTDAVAQVSAPSAPNSDGSPQASSNKTGGKEKGKSNANT